MLTTNTTRQLVLTLGLVAGLAGLSACEGGGGGTPANQEVWKTWDGRPCDGPAAGCDYYANGTQIYVTEDPYYTAGTGEDYGWWTSPDGITYSNGYPINAAAGSRGRDSISNGAMAQKEIVKDNASRLAAKYSLSAETSTNIAQAMTDWAALGKSRKRTQADVAAFTKRLSGLDINEVTNALSSLSQGDASAYDQAISKAARNWSTSPDNMKRIMNDWFAAQQR